MKIRFLLLLLTLVGCVQKKEADKQKHLPKANTIYVISQNDSPYERGKVHGMQLREEISSRIVDWERVMSLQLKVNKDSIQSIINEHTDFLKTIKEKTPHLLEEINGIADGAEIDRSLLLAYNLGEEIYSFCTANFENCSTIAFKGASDNTISYNQDLPDFLHGRGKPVILKYNNYYVFTMPGIIGLSGASKSLAVSCNSLPMLNMDKTGLPLAFCLREILKKDSMKEALDFIQNTPMAIPQNLLLVSSGDIINVEVSKNSIKHIKPDSTGFVAHTNFPIQNSDYKYPGYEAPFCPRYHYLDSLKMGLAKTSFHKKDIADLLWQSCGKYPITNNETYLRYLAVYGEINKIIFMNPNSGEQINLSF